jgi:hypothetical protein
MIEGIPDIGECIRWPGNYYKNGYPMARHMVASSYLYSLYHSKSYEAVDHLCGNRWCFNLYHLEGVTQEVNNNRLRSLYCKNCSGDLTLSGSRQYICVPCNRIRSREYNRNKKHRS